MSQSHCGATSTVLLHTKRPRRGPGCLKMDPTPGIWTQEPLQKLFNVGFSPQMKSLKICVVE